MCGHVAYHSVHGTYCLCTSSASAFVHWAIPTSVRFLFRSLSLETLFCSFLIDIFQFVMRCHLRTCGWCIILAHVAVHRWMASNSQYTLSSQSSLQKGTGGKSQLCSKQSSNGPFTENFLTIGGNLERYMYRVTVLGWLKKEEERKKEDKLFWLLTFSGLPL